MRSLGCAQSCSLFTLALRYSTSTNVASFKLIVLDEADAMTQVAQGALRRGAYLLTLVHDLPVLTAAIASLDPASHRAVHEECALLHHLQLRQQDHPCHPIQMHTSPLQPSGAGASRGPTDPRRRERRMQLDARWQRSTAEALARRHASRVECLTSLSCSVRSH